MKTILDFYDIKNKDLNDFIINIKKHDVSNKDINYENNPYYILERINSNNQRKQVISRLISEKYDFKTDFPYSLFTDIPALDIIRNNLIKEKEYYSYYISRGKIFITNDRLKCLVCKTEKYLADKIFRFDIDIYVNSYNYQNQIILNPKLKNEYSLENLFIKLDKIDNGKWVIWNNNCVVKTKDKYMSSLDDKDLLQFLKGFTLKK